MKYRIYTVVSAVSLMLCVMVVVMWVRSYWQFDLMGFSWGDRAASHSICSINGRLEYRTVESLRELPATISSNRGWFIVSESSRPSPRGPSRSPWEPDPSVLGFYFGRAGTLTVAGIPTHTLVVWYWLLLVLAAVLPSLWLYRWWHRPPKGHCFNCGYDLRASDQHCPECGTPIPTSHNQTMQQAGEPFGARLSLGSRIMIGNLEASEWKPATDCQIR